MAGNRNTPGAALAVLALDDTEAAPATGAVLAVLAVLDALDALDDAEVAPATALADADAFGGTTGGRVEIPQMTTCS